MKDKVNSLINKLFEPKSKCDICNDEGEFLEMWEEDKEIMWLCPSCYNSASNLSIKDYFDENCTCEYNEDNSLKVICKNCDEALPPFY